MANRYTPTRLSEYPSMFHLRVWLVVSFFGSVGFLSIVCLGAFIHWLRGRIIFRSQVEHPKGCEPSYPDLPNLKRTTDERYYAQVLGMDIEVFKVVAEDGQVLHLHHYYDPSEPAQVRDQRKPVYMQHGLLASSGAYFSGGRNSLAYVFTKAGYDVWLGNNRSWYAAEHSTIDGNAGHSPAYWDWEARDLAYYDLPCFIDAILSHKPLHDKVVYVGHSQGCTQMTINLRNPALSHVHAKIEFIGFLAPAIYPGKLFHTRGFLKFLINRGVRGYKCVVGPGVFLGIMTKMRNRLATEHTFGWGAYVMMNYLFGWTADNFEDSDKIRDIHFIFIASMVSSRLMTWWTAKFVPESFSNQLLPKSAYKSDAHHRWDNPVVVDNDQSYFPFTEEWFSESNVSIPICAFTGGKDRLVDGLRYAAHMKNGEPNYREGDNFFHYHLDDYTHVDVVWAQNLPKLVAEPLLKQLRQWELRDQRASGVRSRASRTESEKVFDKYSVSSSVMGPSRGHERREDSAYVEEKHAISRPGTRSRSRSLHEYIPRDDDSVGHRRRSRQDLERSRSRSRSRSHSLHSAYRENAPNTTANHPLPADALEIMQRHEKARNYDDPRSSGSMLYHEGSPGAAFSDDSTLNPSTRGGSTNVSPKKPGVRSVLAAPVVAQ
ncbi:hypothetical protein DICA4_D05292 [Diutina catenulata]